MAPARIGVAAARYIFQYPRGITETRATAVKRDEDAATLIEKVTASASLHDTLRFM